MLAKVGLRLLSHYWVYGRNSGNAQFLDIFICAPIISTLIFFRQTLSAGKRQTTKENEMKTGGSWLSALLFCSLVAASGCAKQELVKKDELAAPSASTVAKQSASSETVKNAAAGKEQSTGVPVKQTTPAVDQEAATSKAAATAALEKVYFGFDSAILTDQAREILASNAKYLKNNTTAKVRIEGNCDERGSAEYNLALGEKRAKSAQNYLVSMGVSSERLSTISYGKEKPFDSGHDEAAWAKNRRDEFVILSK
jgi:peptidoglycan-associated lipoprotein